MDDSSRQGRKRPSADPSMRYEVTIHPSKRMEALAAVEDLDLDRVPDPEGGVRALATVEEAARLAERGYEVRILQPLPVKPLDPSLVADDDSVMGWLERRVEGIEREEPR